MKDFYYELILETNKDFDKFCEFVNIIYDEAIEEIENKLIIRSENDLTNLIDELKKSEFSFDYTIEKKENKNWIDEYKKNIKPIIIDKFYIYPSWEKEKQGYINILLEPTLAFGSGHHETTYSCIKAISKYVQKNHTFLDVGCGSGILSICAAKLGAKVDLCDTDELAITNAKENFKLNNVDYKHIWCGSINKTKEKYDIITANIVADILIFLKNDFYDRLNNNGLLILSGILDRYENKIVDSFSKFKIVEKITKNEWITIILQKDKNE